MKNEIKQLEEKKQSEIPQPKFRSKFQVYGDVMLEKQVGRAGNCGRVYLPGSWAGLRVKVIRLNSGL